MRVAVVVLAVLASVAADSEVSVTTSKGVVTGLQTDTARKFKGIPLAAPPLDDLRWAVPQEPKPWAEPLRAMDYSPGCPQACDEPPFICPKTLSEDCLYLNVFTPANMTGKGPLPVLVFWSGGNYKLLVSGDVLYEGDYMVNQTDIILVTANYRLGALGFVVTEDIEPSLGLLDQIEGLKWVQKEIAAFGGDPNQVTIMGQSAGAGSVLAHMTGNASWPYFHRAISESNPSAIEYKNREQALKVGERFVKELGCAAGDMTCMREMSFGDVITAQLNTEASFFPYPKPLRHAYIWSPTLEEQPLTAMTKGNFHRVPFMRGSVKEEGIQFIDQLFTSPLEHAEYDVILAAVFGLGNVAQIRHQYPILSNFSDLRDTLFQPVTQFTFTCPGRLVTRSVAKLGIPTYIYNYEHALSFDAWGPEFSYCDHRVCHGSELPILFHSAHLKGYTPTTAEEVLSAQLVHYWGHFVRGATGEIPAPKGGVSWPVYTPDRMATLLLDTNTVSTATDFLKEKCDMWDRVGYLHE